MDEKLKSFAKSPCRATRSGGSFLGVLVENRTRIMIWANFAIFAIWLAGGESCTAREGWLCRAV
jgi:hypothetical protein